MKRKRAREILVDSFRELAEREPVDAITIRAITENCGYSTATFYRQFRDKYDLIAWEHTQRVENILGKLGEEGHTWRQTLIEAACQFHGEREYLANLIRHTSGHDSFVRYKTEINYAAVRKLVLRASGQEELDERLDMYVRIYVLGTVNLTCEWLLGKYKASPETLAEVFDLSLPEPLRPYLQ